MKTHNSKFRTQNLQIRFKIELLVVLIFIGSILARGANAGPQSTTYELKQYGFGAGGISVDTSTNYQLFGTVGEVDFGKLTSTTYGLASGLVFTLKANVPPAPTFTNPATDYERLKFVINTGGNPTSATFAIAISTDNFVSDTRYIKADNTIGTTLTSSDYKTYSAWGGASGSFVTGLLNNTTYYIKVKARQGVNTETEFGPVASQTTSTPSLTFSLDSSSIAFSNLNAGNSYTDSSKQTILTTSTNAYNGYVVYAKETQQLTSGGSTISDFSGTNSSPAVWSGAGFGYTTSDIDLQTGGIASRFSGSKYAGLTTTSSQNPVADHLGPIQDTAISNEQFTISYRVTAAGSQTPGAYTTTIEYIILPTY